ncbi:ras-related protein Rab-28-like [Pollicipes pollicipes]|uniref:ras-related protein Rab-28-like n=1 Tax=Pollicipes pollicipes TaxID=41117 RepID=UPI001885933A|nr:ras-related protein Rab-28-like [Pollicipes pollicipes]
MMESQEEEGGISEGQLKIVLVGDSGSGKTALCCRYTQDTFSPVHSYTSGVEFYLKRIRLTQERSVTLQLWDVGGTSLSGGMLDKYLYGAHLALFVYDVSNYTSFENLETWLMAVTEATRHQSRPLRRILIANKCEWTEARERRNPRMAGRAPSVALRGGFVGRHSALEHIRAVRVDKHKSFAAEHDMLAFLVSAQSGEHVAQVFQHLAAVTLGARLTRADMEHVTPVVRAQIAKPRPETALPRPPTASKMRVSSELCCLQ